LVDWWIGGLVDWLIGLIRELGKQVLNPHYPSCLRRFR
jgi:hypothetical protein